ncbi:MAG: molybdopterin cofactor-binding domain-containing protein [Zhaonellaceae bacterium]
MIRIEYEELPAVFDPEEAVEDDAPRVHPAGNIITKIINKAGDVEKGFAEADLVFEDKYQLPPVHHGAIEMHGVLAKFDSRGTINNLEQQSKCICPSPYSGPII